MLFRLILLIALVEGTVSAQWPRYVHGVKGGANSRPFDSPSAHPLAYFTADQRSRPDDDRLIRVLDLCGLCRYPAPSPSPSELEDRAKTHSNLRLVGKIGALTIYDLEYFFGGLPYDGPHVGTVLVETASSEFHEILVQQQAQADAKIYPSALLNAGQQQVLQTRYLGGGHPNIEFETYFSFTEGGAQLLDLKPLTESASKAMPVEMVLSWPPGKFDFGTLSWTVLTEWRDARNNPAHCCGGGRVRVTFRLEGGRVIATGATYAP